MRVNFPIRICIGDIVGSLRFAAGGVSEAASIRGGEWAVSHQTLGPVEGGD